MNVVDRQRTGPTALAPAINGRLDRLKCIRRAVEDGYARTLGSEGKCGGTANAAFTAITLPANAVLPSPLYPLSKNA